MSHDQEERQKSLAEQKIESRNQAAYLVSLKLLNDFKASKRLGRCVGPEGFAECWLKDYLEGSNPLFEDLVVQFFVQRLAGKKC